MGSPYICGHFDTKFTLIRHLELFLNCFKQATLRSGPLLARSAYRVDNPPYRVYRGPNGLPIDGDII